MVSYTWSHSIDIASTDAFATYLNTASSVANPNIDRGNSDFDIRHAFTAGMTYNLPSPESSKIAHVALGGWSVDSFIFARTAPPMDVVGALVFADGIALYPRPDVVPGVPLVRRLGSAARHEERATVRLVRRVSLSEVISEDREVPQRINTLCAIRVI